VEVVIGRMLFVLLDCVISAFKWMILFLLELYSCCFCCIRFMLQLWRCSFYMMELSLIFRDPRISALTLTSTNIKQSISIFFFAFFTLSRKPLLLKGKWRSEVTRWSETIMSQSSTISPHAAPPTTSVLVSVNVGRHESDRATVAEVAVVTPHRAPRWFASGLYYAQGQHVHEHLTSFSLVFCLLAPCDSSYASSLYWSH
jgi:hypothetical protein